MDIDQNDQTDFDFNITKPNFDADLKTPPTNFMEKKVFY